MSASRGDPVGEHRHASGEGRAASLGLTPELLRALDRLTLPSRRRRARAPPPASDAPVATVVRSTSPTTVPTCPGTTSAGSTGARTPASDRLLVRLYEARGGYLRHGMGRHERLDGLGSHRERTGGERHWPAPLPTWRWPPMTGPPASGFAGHVVGRAGRSGASARRPRLWAALAALPRGVTTDWGVCRRRGPFGARGAWPSSSRTS